MNDCPNAEVRDLLPDLMHGRLDPANRAVVEAHVASCADCRAELALLRELRASTGRAPRVDVAAISAAVPAYRAPVGRSWVGWRTAAAVTLVVAGASSIVVTQRIGTRQPDSVVVPSTSIETAAPTVQKSGAGAALPVEVIPPAPVTPEPREPKTAVRNPEPAERELAMSGGTLTDLSDRELASLLKEIESLDAVPSTDVESVPVSPIAPRRGSP